MLARIARPTSPRRVTFDAALVRPLAALRTRASSRPKASRQDD